MTGLMGQVPAMTTRSRRHVAIWLLAVALLVCAMVVLGGVTRLTGSGLSMTEWKPVTGWLPPLDLAEWNAAFDRYRQSPEYRDFNRGMSLDEFRTIFWYEYAHRLLGRVLGLAFMAPFGWFLVTRQLPRRLALWLAFILALGGLQGVLGWFMVASGLVDRPSVSPFRLAMHLALAFAILGMLVWTAASLLGDPGYGSAEPGVRAPRRRALWILALVSLTIVAGAFVAGLDAGLYYNTFPLMDGRLVPASWADMEPWWINPFLNPAAAQFNHRFLAVVTLVAALLMWRSFHGLPLMARTRHLAASAALAAVVQAGLGIATLLAYVPVWLGALHQAGALVVFTLALLVVHSLRQRVTP